MWDSLLQSYTYIRHQKAQFLSKCKTKALIWTKCWNRLRFSYKYVRLLKVGSDAVPCGIVSIKDKAYYQGKYKL